MSKHNPDLGKLGRDIARIHFWYAVQMAGLVFVSVLIFGFLFK